VPRVRSIGLRPPFSAHSRFAAALLVLLSAGVVLAAHVPQVSAAPGRAKRVHAATYERQLLRCWRLEAPIWAVLLGWLLMTDPKARGQPSVNKETRCRHGCVTARRPRTRHCRLCNKCVDGFDHHCLWLNTCVGTHNYRAWLGFMASLFVWTILGSSIAWTALWQVLALRGRALAVGYRPALLLTGLGAAFAAGWLLALLALHAYLAWKDLTTLEWIISRGGGSITGTRTLVRRCAMADVMGGCDTEGPSLQAEKPSSFRCNPMVGKLCAGMSVSSPSSALRPAGWMRAAKAALAGAAAAAAKVEDCGSGGSSDRGGGCGSCGGKSQ